MDLSDTRWNWLKADVKRIDWFWPANGVAVSDQLITFKLQHMSDDEFRKLKQRWASHIYRKKRKTLSCEISPESYNQLTRLKGTLTLADALETIIATTYEAQTRHSMLTLKSTTTPLTRAPSMEITHSNIIDLQQQLNLQRGAIEDLKGLVLEVASKMTKLGIDHG